MKREFPAGQSLPAAMYRWFCDVPASAQEGLALRCNVLSLDPDRVRYGVLALRLVLLGILVRLVWGSRVPRTSSLWLAEAGLVLGFGLLVGPLVHKAHLVWMLPGFAAWLAHARGRGEWLFGGFAAFAIAGSTSALMGREGARLWNAGGGLTLGSLALWIALAMILGDCGGGGGGRFATS
ncbi:MAG: hypothetical protein R3E96_03720 [Planctomycetota bacterium]